MKIALIGTRGIPARYGGFETAIEHLAELFSAHGHRVTVYCRAHEVSEVIPSYRGARLLYPPSLKNKYLETISHTFVGSVHLAVKARPDVAVYFIAGNSPLLAIPRLARVPALINVDGLDWRRDKWPAVAKWYIRTAEWLAPRLATVITDARDVQSYYRDVYHRDTVYIPYGASPPTATGTATLERYGLEPGGYVLYVGRLVPENRVHLLTAAYRQVKSDFKLVVVGGASFEDDFVQRLHREADERTVFTGYVFGDGYDELRTHAHAMVVPHAVGGTHPVLLEALAAGQCVIANDNQQNREVVGTAGLYFDERLGEADLAANLQRVVDDAQLVADLRSRAEERAKIYSWERVARAYEDVFDAVVEGSAFTGTAFDGRTADLPVPAERRRA